MYAFLFTILALPIGYYFKAVIISHQTLISNLVVILAIMTIYPSNDTTQGGGVLEKL
jgi:preprotein translocase subunit SecD